MSQLLVLFALGCAIAATTIGFGWIDADNLWGWLSLSLASFFAATALGDRP